jgi:hypothetical protein
MKIMKSFLIGAAIMVALMGIINIKTPVALMQSSRGTQSYGLLIEPSSACLKGVAKGQENYPLPIDLCAKGQEITLTTVTSV